MHRLLWFNKIFRMIGFQIVLLGLLHHLFFLLHYVLLMLEYLGYFWIRQELLYLSLRHLLKN